MIAFLVKSSQLLWTIFALHNRVCFVAEGFLCKENLLRQARTADCGLGDFDDCIVQFPSSNPELSKLQLAVRNCHPRFQHDWDLYNLRLWSCWKKWSGWAKIESPSPQTLWQLGFSKITILRRTREKKLCIWRCGTRCYVSKYSRRVYYLKLLNCGFIVKLRIYWFIELRIITCRKKR